MQEKELLRYLGLPNKTYVLRTFPFNRLAGQLTLEQRKQFSDAVETRGVRLLATINSQTTNISAYEDGQVSYQEIHLFNIKLSDLKKAKPIYKMLAEVMPYPLLIRFEKDDQVKWIAATHEKLQTSSLLRIKKVFMTNINLDEQLYLDAWSFDESNTYNLKTYYDHIIRQMAQVELENQYHAETNFETDPDRLADIKDLEKQINMCISKAKQETQMDKRIEWQMEANRLKDQKEKLIKGE